MTHGLPASLLCLTLAACGASPPPESVGDGREAEETVPEQTRPTGADDLRALGADATYRDLLRAARTLDDRRDQDSDAGCLVRRGWRLEADLAVAVRPLPSAPDDLDARLAEELGPVTVLSRWGAYGDAGEEGAPRLAFSTVTTTLPPRVEPAVVWVVTDTGVYVRSTASSRPAGPTGVEALEASLNGAGALFVSAEAGVPLSRLAEVLSSVPESFAGRMGLVVPLSAGTRLPAPPEVQEGDAAAICPDGLPALPEDAPLGSMRPERILQSLGPLRQGAEICVGATDGPGAAGGRVVMALRIAADGRVAETCIMEDATDDPTLRACLLRAARTIAFPPPESPGTVDVALPLALSPLPSQRQRPVCE